MLSRPSLRVKRMTISRRSWLKTCFALINGLVGALFTIPLVGFVVTPLFRRPTRHWVEIGNLTDFKAGEPRARRLRYTNALGFRDRPQSRNVWVTLGPSGDVTVFSAECTHLGCNVIWKPDRAIYFCPCHNGEFSPEGVVLAGPPPRPLTRLPTKIEGGKIWAEV